MIKKFLDFKVKNYNIINYFIIIFFYFKGGRKDVLIS